MKKILIAAILLIVIICVYFAVQSPQAPVVNSVQKTPEQVISGLYAEADRWQPVSGQDGVAKQLSAARLYALAFDNLPESLQGTRMDGGFRLDEQGRLIAEPQVVQVFEYFMSSIGEDDLDTIIGRVKNLIEAALPDSAKSDAHRLLAQYLQYRQQQGEIQQAGGALMGGDINGLRETFNQVKQMRRDIFGEANADRLFQAEEAYLDFNLNSMEINQSNPDMSELDKLAAVRELSINLPENHRKVVAEQLLQRELDIRTQQLEQSGASDEALRLMREQLLGSEAAERLGELDRQRGVWDQRVAAFKVDYENSLSAFDAEIAPAEQTRIMNRLFQQHSFTAPEQKRVKGILGLY